MSARLSATTKDLICKAYENKMKDLKDKIREIEDNIEKDIRNEIRKSKEFKDFREASDALGNMITTCYPDVQLYSAIRDAYRMDDNYNIIYMNWSEKDKALSKNAKWLDLKEQEKLLIKEKNNLLFKLENAPKKSDEYINAYEQLQEIISVYG